MFIFESMKESIYVDLMFIDDTDESMAVKLLTAQLGPEGLRRPPQGGPRRFLSVCFGPCACLDKRARGRGGSRAGRVPLPS